MILQPLVFNAIYFAFSFYHRDRYKAYIPYAVQFSLLFITSVVPHTDPLRKVDAGMEGNSILMTRSCSGTRRIT